MKLLEGLREIDETISTQWRTLTCEQVSGIYNDIWYGVKELNGNAENFTGFVEFVIFRFLVNMFGGASPRAINKETSAFQCDLDGRCWLGHGEKLIGEETLKPDVTIWWREPSYTYWQAGGDL